MEKVNRSEPRGRSSKASPMRCPRQYRIGGADLETGDIGWRDTRYHPVRWGGRFGRVDEGGKRWREIVENGYRYHGPRRKGEIEEAIQRWAGSSDGRVSTRRQRDEARERDEARRRDKARRRTGRNRERTQGPTVDEAIYKRTWGAVREAARRVVTNGRIVEVGRPLIRACFDGAGSETTGFRMRRRRPIYLHLRAGRLRISRDAYLEGAYVEGRKKAGGVELRVLAVGVRDRGRRQGLGKSYGMREEGEAGYERGIDARSVLAREPMHCYRVSISSDQSVSSSFLAWKSGFSHRVDPEEMWRRCGERMYRVTLGILKRMEEGRDRLSVHRAYSSDAPEGMVEKLKRMQENGTAKQKRRAESKLASAGFRRVLHVELSRGGS